MSVANRVRRLLPALAARRRWVIAAALLGTSAAVGWSVGRPSLYEASVGVVVAPASGTAASPGDIAAALNVARTVVTSDGVREAVRQELNEVASPPAVQFTRQRSSEPVARLTVRSSDPQRAVVLVERYASVADASLRSGSGLSLGMVGSPLRPVDPVSPRPIRDAAIGLLVGLFVGAGLAVARDRSDNGVRPGFDIEGMTGLPLLGTIPRLRVTDSGSPVNPRANRTDEAFKLLARDVIRLGGLSQLRTVQVLGASEGSGATTVATSLAVALGLSGHEAVLVDGDLRTPRVHEILALPYGPGLVGITTGHADSIRVNPVRDRLDVVTAGGTVPSPADLLGGRQFADLLEFFVEDGAIVVLDSHPLEARPDALGSVRRVDGVIVVLRSARSSATAVTETIRQIVEAGGRPIGIVLNQVGRGQYRGSRHRRHLAPLAPAAPSRPLAPMPPPGPSNSSGPTNSPSPANSLSPLGAPSRPRLPAPAQVPNVDPFAPPFASALPALTAVSALPAPLANPEPGQQGSAPVPIIPQVGPADVAQQTPRRVSVGPGDDADPAPPRQPPAASAPPPPPARGKIVPPPPPSSSATHSTSSSPDSHK